MSSKVSHPGPRSCPDRDSATGTNSQHKRCLQKRLPTSKGVIRIGCWETYCNKSHHSEKFPVLNEPSMISCAWWDFRKTDALALDRNRSQQDSSTAPFYSLPGTQQNYMLHVHGREASATAGRRDCGRRRREDSNLFKPSLARADREAMTDSVRGLATARN